MSHQKFIEFLSKNNLIKYIFIKSPRIVEYKAFYILPTYSKKIELLILIVKEIEFIVLIDYF